jgi:3-oxoacyl-[acyl-carrier-protein] synthase III
MTEPSASVRILGLGHSLGDIVRGNDDPVFDYLRAHPVPDKELFAGLKYRRVLGSDQTLTSIMVDACRSALANASLAVTDIDLIIGSGSVSEFVAPNALAAVHLAMQLPGSCRVIPLNSDYTTFLDGLRIAHDMIRAGTIRNALVVAGNNWTQHMDYTQAVSVAASDAAGAAVVGRSSDTGRFTLVDCENQTQSSWYGALHMSARAVPQPPAPAPQPPLCTTPLMSLDPVNGRNAVLQFGIPVPPQVVGRLLKRHDLEPSDITLVPHQTSVFVAAQWKNLIAPALYVSTLEQLADMVSAAVPVNFSLGYEKIPTNHVVLMGIGMEMHCTALLCSRTPC